LILAPAAYKPLTSRIYRAMRILLAEDDAIIADGLIRALRKAGYASTMSGNGLDADTALLSQTFDLLISTSVCPSSTASCPAPAAFAQVGDAGIDPDCQDGIEDGCAGSMRAPTTIDQAVRLARVEARVRALTRRGTGQATRIEFGALSYDQAERIVKVHGQLIDLSAREMAVLEVLMLRAGRLVGKENCRSLVRLGRGSEYQCIEVYVHRLRKKIELPACVLPRCAAWLLPGEIQAEASARPAAAADNGSDESRPLPPCHLRLDSLLGEVLLWILICCCFLAIAVVMTIRWPTALPGAIRRIARRAPRRTGQVRADHGTANKDDLQRIIAKLAACGHKDHAYFQVMDADDIGWQATRNFPARSARARRDE